MKRSSVIEANDRGAGAKPIRQSYRLMESITVMIP